MLFERFQRTLKLPHCIIVFLANLPKLLFQHFFLKLMTLLPYKQSSQTPESAINFANREANL